MNIEHIFMSKASGYGHFEIKGRINGEWVKVITTNSEAFDYINDDDNPEKQAEALQYCKRRLEMAYNYNKNIMQ